MTTIIKFGGVRLHVNSNPIELRVWGIVISRSLIRNVIMGIRYQCRHYLQRSFSEYGFN